MDVTGLILAGGRGTRMGNVDKGLQPFEGTSMAQRVLDRLQPQVQAVMISANQNLAAYAAFGVPVWPDNPVGFLGPLAGLYTGLQHCQTPLLVTAPCDSPFLPLDLVSRLKMALIAQGSEVAVAVTIEGDQRQVQPVFTLAQRSVSSHLAQFLAQGGRKVDAWYATLKVTEVVFDDVAAFRNINTQAELQQYTASPP